MPEVIPTLESIANGRFPTVKIPLAIPHNCLTCHSAVDDRGFIDLRQDFDWYGALYICSTCVLAMGRCFGLTDPDNHKRLVDMIETINTLYVEVVDENKQLRGIVDGLKGLSIDNGHSPAIDTSSVDHLLNISTDIQAKTKSDDIFDAGKPEVNQPVNEPRPLGISDFAAIDPEPKSKSKPKPPDNPGLGIGN